jgi:dsDNA-specific endonuclease/ATPase MutS2
MAQKSVNLSALKNESMQLCIGDRVRILNEAMEGTVSKIVSKKEVYVTTADGFDFCYPVNELLLVNEKTDSVAFEVDLQTISHKIKADRKRSVSTERHHNVPFRQYMQEQAITGVRGEELVEIDLHIEELLRNPAAVNNWEKINIQLEHCKRCMEEAIAMKVTNIVFIHGIGAGKLKQEIRQLLSVYHGVEVFDANYERYGYGATQVRIMGLFTS